MEYGNEIDRIITVFEVQNRDESELQRLRDHLWDILDDLSYWSYNQGIDSVHMCCADECGY
jgi:hypothetical protein